MDAFAGKIISLYDIPKLPGRNALFADKNIQDDIKARRPLNFLPITEWEHYMPVTNGVLNVNTKYATRIYKLTLFGLLSNGQKIAVILNGIQPYFEIAIKPGPDETRDSFIAKITKICSDENFKVVRTEIIQGLAFMGFNNHAEFLRLYFNSNSYRINAIKHFDGLACETFHNDISGPYYRVYCRDVMATLVNWTTINNYTVNTNHPWFRSDVRVFEIDHQNWNRITDETVIERLSSNDKSVVCTWDIETYDNENAGLPNVDSKSSEVFMISANFAHINSGMIRGLEIGPEDKKYPFPKPRNYVGMFVITTIPSNPIPNRTVIVVKDETELILAFASLVKIMIPDYIVGFNDSNYDWKWIYGRASQLRIDRVIERYMSMINLEAIRTFEHKVAGQKMSNFYPWYKFYSYKLTPELEAKGHFLIYPGYICIDMMPMLRLIFGNPDKYSLGFFLAAYKIGSKVDMPYHRMFIIYKLSKELYSIIPRDCSAKVQRSIAESLGIIDIFDKLNELMVSVSEYCIIDAARCQDLLNITSLINEKREFVDHGYTSMYDAIWLANAAKVRSMLIARGQKLNLHFDNLDPKNPDTGTYCGAYVFNPKKGIINSKPRLPVEYIKELTTDVIGYLKKYGTRWADFPEEVKKVLSKFPILTEWLKKAQGRPVAALDFNSLYPSIMMAYNLSPEKMVFTLEEMLKLLSEGYKLHYINFKFGPRDIKAWAIRHNYTGDANDPKANFGLFPTVLKELFDARKSLKLAMEPLAERIEYLEGLSPEQFNTPEVQNEYEDIKFRYNKINAKQKAAKIYMNTFYGEAGNATSPLRVLALAGGVTTAGVSNIKKAAEFIMGKGWDVLYGDTDSVYSSPPNDVFKELDNEYYYDQTIGLEEYHKAVVEKSFTEIKELRKSVNDMLKADNGTDFLTMGYEEILFPTVLLGKKKYFGIPHEKTFNEHPKKLFIKGVESIKKGVSQLLVHVSNDIMWKMVSRTFHGSMIESITDKIRELYTTKYPVSMFIKMATYKPPSKGKSGNISVLKFVKRMQDLDMAPEPYSRFGFVVVKKPNEYDVKGRKVALGVGDCMEYPHIVEKEDMEIDINYYVENNICGQLARFLSNDPRFWNCPQDVTDDAKYELEEKRSMTLAEQYLKLQCKKWSKPARDHGLYYRNTFKVVNTEFQNELNETFGNTDISNAAWDLIINSSSSMPKSKPRSSFEINNQIFIELKESITKLGIAEAKKDAWDYCTRLENKKKLVKVYKLLVEHREKSFIKDATHLEDKLRDMTNSVRKFYEKRTKIVQEVIDDHTNSDNITLDPADIRKCLVNGELTREDMFNFNKVSTQWQIYKQLIYRLYFSKCVLEIINN